VHVAAPGMKGPDRHCRIEFEQHAETSILARHCVVAGTAEIPAHGAQDIDCASD
jgi:hypothetical protein